MKKVLLLVVVLMFVASPVLLAQDVSFGVNGELAMPTGDIGDTSSIGFGVSGQVEYPFSGQLIGVGNIGFLYFGEKDNSGLTMSVIPIKAGAKYMFDEAGTGFYGIGQLGMYLWSWKVEYELFGETISADGNESEFGFAFGGGYLFDSGLDLSAQYETADADYFSIKVGYRF